MKGSHFTAADKTTPAGAVSDAIRAGLQEGAQEASEIRQARTAGADLRRLLNTLRVETPMLLTALKVATGPELSADAASVETHLKRQSLMLTGLSDNILTALGHDPSDAASGWIRGSLARQLTGAVSQLYAILPSDTPTADLGKSPTLGILADMVATGFKSVRMPDDMPVSAESWQIAELATRSSALSPIVRAIVAYDWLYKPDTFSPRVMSLFDEAVQLGLARCKEATTSPISPYDESMIRRSVMKPAGELLAQCYEDGARAIAAVLRPMTKPARRQYIAANRGIPFDHIPLNFRTTLNLLFRHSFLSAATEIPAATVVAS